VLAAERGKEGSMHPSVSAAVGGASVAVLSAFFPLDVSTFENQLDADLAAPGWPGEQNDDAAAGEAIGRAVGAAVNSWAATDNYLVANPGAPPVGPGRWVSSGAPIVRGPYGTRPFLLTSGDQIRPGPPPAFGSPEFLAGLAEIRTVSDTRTAAQIALAQFYAWGTAPFTPGNLNLIADDLIVAHKRTEKEAARILAYANASSFDAHIACFDAKFAYWFIRPTQADPAITLPIPLPNHPSYPSGHSCVTGGFMYPMIDAFPSERERLEKIITDAGLSRMYGGLHYGFDVEAGQAIGRAAAALARTGSLE
jgi:membrane-associated phospholipid phosphatase